MHAHDLHRINDISLATPRQGSATILEVHEQSYVLSEGSGARPLTARRAASCLLEPAVGDRVWFVVEPQRCFVIAVLERDAEDRPAQLSVEGEAELRADRLTIHAREHLNLRSEELQVRGRIAKVVLGECSTVLRTLFTHASKATFVGKHLETLAERITAHSKTSQRSVEQLDQVKAGTIDYRATSSAQIGAEHALITGAELVKVEGGQIHLG
ncbi:MAG: DUF3540 domain-containing protein [Enhygromyxa sp.]